MAVAERLERAGFSTAFRFKAVRYLLLQTCGRQDPAALSRHTRVKPPVLLEVLTRIYFASSCNPSVAPCGSLMTAMRPISLIAVTGRHDFAPSFNALDRVVSMSSTTTYGIH
jgi:hypothetical protein